jgi:hypothetical protein
MGVSLLVSGILPFAAATDQERGSAGRCWSNPYLLSGSRSAMGMGGHCRGSDKTPPS